MQVLILGENANLVEIYCTNIKAYTDKAIEKCKHVGELLKSYQETNQPQVIITPPYFGSNKAFERIYKEIDVKNDQVCLVCLGEISNQDYYPEVHFVEDETDLKSVIKLVADFFNVTAQDMASKKMDNFYPIEKSLIMHSIDYAVDIYLKEDEEFKIFLDRGSPLSQDAHKLIMSSNTYSLYVQSIDRLKLINGITDGMIRKLSDNDPSAEEQLKASEASMKYLGQIINKLGVSKKTVELADATVESVKSLVRSSKSMSALLGNLLENKTSFRYQHAMITIYIGSKVIEEAEWGSKEQLTKLSYVALFSDISLNDDKLARIQSHEELEAASLSEEDYNLVNNHAAKSAALVAKFRRAPIGVESLIKQHHGSRKGIGLTMDSFNIAPIGLIFMISSAFASDSIKAKEEGRSIDKDEYLETIEAKFGHNPKFKDYIISFEKINIS